MTPGNPIYRLLDELEWTEIQTPQNYNVGIPHATHRGMLRIGEFSLRVYRLSDGQRIIDAGDFDKFFGDEGEAKGAGAE